jgi:hypothetical protein
MTENTDSIFNQLNQLNEVEVPPFLITRIRQSLQNQQRQLTWTSGRVWLVSASFVCVMLMNTWVIFNYSGSKQYRSESTALYSVYNNNNIYR